MAEFDRKRETETFVRCISCRIRDPKILGVGLFGPRPPVRILYLLHSDFAEFASDLRILPTLERRFDDKTKTAAEVLIFNPAPMQVRYRQNSTESEIVGGETVDGIQLHDIVSFCSMLQRKEYSI